MLKPPTKQDWKNSRKHPGFRGVVKDSFFYLPAKVVPAVMGLIAIAVYTRLLSPKEYGLYILVITTVSTVSLFAFSWLNQSILRYFEENRDKNSFNNFISTSFISLLALLFAISAAWYLLTVVLKAGVKSDLTYLLRIGILLLWAQAGYSTVLIMFRADRQALKYSLFSSADAVGRLCLSASLICFLSFGADGILWAAIVVTGGIFLWGLISLYRRWRIRIAPFSRDLLKKYALYGMPLAVVGAGELILSASDRYLIGYFLGTGEVGVYAAGYNITSVAISFIFIPLLLAAYPVLIQAYEHEGEERVRVLLKDLLGVYLLILLPAIFGITALSRDMTAIMLGKKFVEAGIIIPWVAGGVFFMGLTWCFNKPFQLKKRTKILIYPVILGSLINIVLNIILISRLGIQGAAIATLISYFSYFSLTLWLSKKIFTWSFPWYTLVKTLLASAGMYLSLISIQTGEMPAIRAILTKISLGIVVYSVILFILRERLIYRGFDCIKDFKRVQKKFI